MSLASRLIYKWLAPTMQELRFTVERALGAAFDWSAPADRSSLPPSLPDNCFVFPFLLLNFDNYRNSMMYESAVPLAKLSSPLLNIDDTFILQEYFVPRKRFHRWIDLAKPIYIKLSRSATHKYSTIIVYIFLFTVTPLAILWSPSSTLRFASSIMTNTPSLPMRAIPRVSMLLCFIIASAAMPRQTWS